MDGASKGNVKYQGTAITIGEREYIVPPLNFRQLEDFHDDLEKMRAIKDGGTDSFASIASTVPIVHAAIRRNYPDLTIDELRDSLDLHNYREVIAAVMGVSGITDEILKGRGLESLPGGQKPLAKKAS